MARLALEGTTMGGAGTESDMLYEAGEGGKENDTKEGDTLSVVAPEGHVVCRRRGGTH